MESKSYFFKDTEFKTKKNVLLIESAWLPLQMIYDNYLMQLNDMSGSMDEFNRYLEKLRLLNLKDDKDKHDLRILEMAENRNEDIIEKVKSAILVNEDERKKIDQEFQADAKAVRQKELRENAVKYSLMKICSVEGLIKIFLEEYLTGDFEKLDWEDEEIKPFVQKIIIDFFLQRINSQNR